MITIVLFLHTAAYSSSTFFVYLPFRNITAHDGDTNVPLYAIVAGIGNTQLSFRISYPPNTGLTVIYVAGRPMQGYLNGPVYVSDTGTTITCTDEATFSQTATLTVLGKSYCVLSLCIT